MMDLSLKSPKTGKSKGLECVLKFSCQQDLPLRRVGRLTAEVVERVF